MMAFALNEKSQQQQIWEALMSRGGALGIRAWADACIEDGIYDEDQLRELAIEGVMKRCKHVARTKDDAGLPLAAVVNEAETIVARQFWLFEHYQYAWRERNRKAMETLAMRDRLKAECIAKYGIAPDEGYIPPSVD